MLEPHHYNKDLNYIPQVLSKEYLLRLYIPIIRFMILYNDTTNSANAAVEGSTGLNIIQRRGIEMVSQLIENVN